MNVGVCSSRLYLCNLSTDHRWPDDKEGEAQYWLHANSGTLMQNEGAVINGCGRSLFHSFPTRLGLEDWHLGLGYALAMPDAHLLVSVFANLCAAQAVALQRRPPMQHRERRPPQGDMARWGMLLSIPGKMASILRAVAGLRRVRL